MKNPKQKPRQSLARGGRLNPISKRRRAVLTEDAIILQEFMGQHPICQACDKRDSQERHHMRGRHGTHMLDKTTWLAVCRRCHRWIHNNPAEARKRGWLA